MATDEPGGPILAVGAEVELRPRGDEATGVDARVVSSLEEGVVLAASGEAPLPALAAGAAVTVVATAELRPAEIAGVVAGSSTAGVAVRVEGGTWRAVPAPLFPPRVEVERRALIVPSSPRGPEGLGAPPKEPVRLTLAARGLCGPIDAAEPPLPGAEVDLVVALDAAGRGLLRGTARVERRAPEVGPRHAVLRLERLGPDDRLALGRTVLQLSRAGEGERRRERPSPREPLGPAIRVPGPALRLPLPPSLPPGERRSAAAASWHDVLEALFAAMEGLYEVASLQAVLDLCLDVATAAIPCEAAAAFSMIPSYDELVCTSVRGSGLEWLLGRPLPLAGTAVGLALDLGGPLAVDDAARDPRLADDVSFLVAGAARTVLAAPLSRSGQVFGGLELVNRLGGAPWPDREVSALEYVAGAASAHLASLEERGSA